MNGNENRRGQFEIARNGHIARLAHEIDGDGWISLLHTFVPPEVRGRGLANELAHVVLEYAKQHGLRVDIVPVCFITRQNIWNISHSSAFVIPNNDLR